MRAHDSVILFSTFGPSSFTTTMPSADFCVLTPHVSMKGATRLLMSCCLFRVSQRLPAFLQGGVAEGRGGWDSYPSTATEYAGSLVNRSDPLRTSLMNFLSRDAQISPEDKEWAYAIRPYSTNAALYAVSVRHLARLHSGFGLKPLLLASDPSSRRRPCLRLVLLVVSITMNTSGSRTGDFHPISSRPCRAYTNGSTRWRISSVHFSRVVAATGQPQR
jgi:hypothetical protein